MLRADLLDTWVAATDAGGSVGFTAPAPVDAITAALDAVLARVRDGVDVLGVLRDGDRAVGMGVLVDSRAWVFPHWRTVSRLMVHPSLQRRGAGTLLLEGLHGTARDLGLEELVVWVRDGEGLQGFYARAGYAEVGRHPGGIRLPDGDRDGVMMLARLAVGQPQAG